MERNQHANVGKKEWKSGRRLPDLGIVGLNERQTRIHSSKHTRTPDGCKELPIFVSVCIIPCQLVSSTPLKVSSIDFRVAVCLCVPFTSIK